MLRGSIIIFSGILSVIFLKRKLYAYNWLGVSLQWNNFWFVLWSRQIGITTVGLLLVGVSSYLSERSADSESTFFIILGMCLVIAGQFANAVQFIVEEVSLLVSFSSLTNCLQYYLKKKNFSPLLVVGAEGCWGILMMLSFVLPIVYFIPGDQPHNHYEYLK